MIKLMYEDIVLGEILTNRTLRVEDALELLEINIEDFINQQNFDDIDYNEFKLVY